MTLNWLEARDRNTKFFHTTFLRHRSGNKIKEIVQKDGSKAVSLEDIRGEAVAFFEDLLNNDDSLSGGDSLLEAIASLVTNQVNQFSTRPFLVEEVKEVAFTLRSDKSPSSDSFPIAFFHHFWPLIGPKVTEAIQ